MYTSGVKALKKLSTWKWIFIIKAILLGFLIVFISVDVFDAKPTTKTPPENALYLDPTQPIEARVADLLSYMTLEEKIGQMTLVEKNSIKEPGHIAKYALGGLLSGSGSKAPQNTAAGWKAMIDKYQEEAVKSRLRIPLLYGADAIHGHGHVPEATVFPHAIGLGATHNPQLIREIANATAEELKATGVNWSFSPNLDQPQDIRWGRVYETFGDDPAVVSSLGAAYLVGLQTSVIESEKGLLVLGTPKHYLGLGGMVWGSSLNENFKIDQGVTADESLLRSVYLPPFKESVDAGALSIMAGLNTWGDKRMVLKKELLTDVLKEELGFKGFVVSDWYGVHEGRKNIFWATVSAVNAGIDMVMLPFDYQTFSQHMKWANRLGFVSDERIDDAASRILYAKFSLGLFDKEDSLAGKSPIPNMEHRALARQAVAESLVLLKNEGSILPIQNDFSHIRVAGSAADNVGKQMGAWSIEWQGIDGDVGVTATSILEGIKARAGGRTVEYDLMGEFQSTNRAELGIAIVGEKPYAEGWGDREFPVLEAEDLLAIKNLQASSEKVIVIIVSGRPLLIENEVASWDGLVVAWLPGSEGTGVADVLFGDAPFTGTLPLPWPRHSEQLPITPDGTTTDKTAVLFEREFGLTQ